MGQGLSQQIIGGTGTDQHNIPVSSDGSYFNVYHLLIPYYIGDKRINISPVYIFDKFQTSLSLSKTAVKFGEYFYPTSVSDGYLFILKGNKITQTDKILPTNEYIKIGNNKYIFDNSKDEYFYIKKGDTFVQSNVGLNINRIISNFDGWSGINLNNNSINFSQLMSNGISYNGKCSYVTVKSNSSSITIGGTAVINGYMRCASGCLITIPVDSLNTMFNVSNAKIVNIILNDSTEG